MVKAVALVNSLHLNVPHIARTHLETIRTDMTSTLFITRIAVIVESTYGVSKHLPRDQREQRFIEKVRGILVRGGRVLLPVVALGRAQVRSS